MSKPQAIDLDQKELDALIERVTEARDYDLTLSSEDCQLTPRYCADPCQFTGKAR